MGKEKIYTIISYLAVLFCLYLIMEGQKSIGYPGLGKMLLGLLGILAVVGVYNYRNQ